MSFHKQGWSGRVGSLGDEAEAAHDAVFPAHHKLGLNRPPMKVGDITLNLRSTPDRMRYDRLVECVGFGRDGKIKVRVNKLNALLGFWTFIAPVYLFVYDKTNDAWSESPLQEWWAAMQTHGGADVFDEGVPYLWLHRNDFPCEPTPMPKGWRDG